MPAFIAFYKGRDRWQSRLISWWTRCEYSHCEMALAVDARDRLALCASSSWLDGGVRYKYIPMDPEKWAVWSLPDVSSGDLQAWFDLHKGEGYDWAGLLGFAFRRIKGWLRLWFCSEACAASMGYSEPWRFDVATLLSVIRQRGFEWTP